MSHLLPGGSLMGGGQLSSVVLSAATTQLLVRHQAVVAEILRHFWTCFPVTSPTLEQKVGENSCISIAGLSHYTAFTLALITVPARFGYSPARLRLQV